MAWWKRGVVIGCLLAVGASPPNPQDPLQVAYRTEAAGDFAKAEQMYRKLALDADCKVKDRNVFFTAGVLARFIDPTSGWDGQARPGYYLRSEKTERIEQAQPRDALDVIAARAAKARIVILNEHHDASRSRVFAWQVAKRLRPLGYDVLAAETFQNSPDAAWAEKFIQGFANDGYARTNSGSYTKDPAFGAFVRQALAMGYRPAAYETTEYGMSGDRRAQIERREKNEADNLVKVLARYPKSKILIYVGFSHAAEGALTLENAPLLWMAARLKALTGIDPLTIDQTEFMPASLQPTDDPLLKTALAKTGRRSVILFEKGEPMVLGQYAHAVDLQVIHPRVRDRQGRPGWFYDLGRTAKPAPANLKLPAGDVLLKAYAKNDASDAVPLDMVVWRAGQPAPTLVLPKGEIRYVAEPMPEPVCPAVSPFFDPPAS
jgi:hypothetical protein